MFSHTADVGVEVFGTTLEDLFQRAAEALFSLITPTPIGKETGSPRHLAVEGMDLNDLWVNYLRELLSLFNGEALLVCRVEIQTVTTEALEARVFVTPYVPSRHEVHQEVKAVTYHQAEVRRTAEGWWGRFIVDV